jgi:hypothetical protein
MIMLQWCLKRCSHEQQKSDITNLFYRLSKISWTAKIRVKEVTRRKVLNGEDEVVAAGAVAALPRVQEAPENVGGAAQLFRTRV